MLGGNGLRQLLRGLVKALLFDKNRRLSDDDWDLEGTSQPPQIPSLTRYDFPSGIYV